MIGTNQPDTVHVVRRAMTESRPGRRNQHAGFAASRQIRIECNFSEHNHDANIPENVELLNEIRSATQEFSPRRFVVGRRASYGGRDVAVFKSQAVLAIY